MKLLRPKSACFTHDKMNGMTIFNSIPKQVKSKG